MSARQAIPAAIPHDMLGLIGQYEYGLEYRLNEIVSDLVENGRLSGSSRPPMSRTSTTSASCPDHVSGQDPEELIEYGSSIITLFPGDVIDKARPAERR
jgi:hypothetical protein